MRATDVASYAASVVDVPWALGFEARHAAYHDGLVVSPKALGSLLAFAVAALGLASPATAVPRAVEAPMPVLVSTSCPPVSAGVLNTAPPVAGARKTVALTFDDGPGRSTQSIINVLRAFHVRATFFNIGWDVSDYPSLVREEAADGFLLGDHTNSHPDMPDLSRAAQLDEITQVGILQRRLTGTVPCVFRPPYGDYDATTLSVAHGDGASLWTWSDNSNDWEARGSGSSYWVHDIERSVIDGSRGEDHPVVLLHDQMMAMPATVAALPYILRSLEQRGYVFVDLLGRTGPPGECGSPTASPFVPTHTALPNGTVMASGGVRFSANRQFVLTMRTDGQLTYAEVGGPTLWSSPTRGSPGATALIDHGTLRVVGTGGQTLWSASGGGPDVDLDLESDGSLALVSGANVRWISRRVLSAMRPGTSLSPGWYVSSPNLRCRLTMTNTGALQLVTADHQTLWWNDARAPRGRSILERSGDLVTVTISGTVVWSSDTSGHAHDILAVTSEGTLRLVGASGVAWATQ